LRDFATEILRREARLVANRRLISLLSRGTGTPALRRQRLVVRADTVLRQVEILSLLWDDADEKAGFRPDQPRHPPGSGRIGGRWSGGAGTIIIEPADPAATIIIEPAGGKPGHHYVPQSLIRKMNLTPEARRLLMDATTGKLEGGRHGYDEAHRRYNPAVERHLERFMRENGIGSRPMTADEAQKLIDSILRSKDPDIWQFNAKLTKRPPPPRSLVIRIIGFIWFLIRRGR
jgi:hypothetical protein